MADLTLAALAMEEAANPMGVRIAPVRGTGSQVELDNGDIQSRMLVTIPIGPLTLAPVADGHEARVRLWVQVMDEEARLSEVTEHPVPVLVREGEIEDARELSWPFAVEVVTAPGPHRVAVGVRDDLAATTSVVTFDLDAGNAPAAPEAPAAVTEAPSLPDTPEQWLAEAAAHYQRSELEAMANAARRALDLTDDIRLRTQAYNALGVALFDKPGRQRAGRGGGRRRLPPRDRGHGRRGFRCTAPTASRGCWWTPAARERASPRRGASWLSRRRGRSRTGRGSSSVTRGLRQAGPALSPTRTAGPGEMIYRVAHEYTDEADRSRRRGHRRPRRQHRRGRLRRRRRGAGELAARSDRERRRGDAACGLPARRRGR